MKFILLLLLLGFAGGFFLPGRQEGTDTPCAALDVRMRRLLDGELAKLPANSNPKVQDAIAAAKAQAPGGSAVAGIVRAKLPFLPAEPTCAAAYWLTVYQPDLRLLAPALLPRG